MSCKPFSLALGLIVGILVSFSVVSAQQPRLLPVDALTLSASDYYEVERMLTGQVQKRQNARLGFEFGGKLQTWLCDEGDSVTKGQALMVLDTGLLKLEVKQLMAQKQQLLAELELAQANRVRLVELDKQSYASDQALDEINSQIRVHKANLNRVDASIGSSQLRIEKSTLYAPFDGVLGDRLVNQGEVVAAGQVVISLQETRQLQVKVGIPNSLVSSIVSSMPIYIGKQRYEAILLSKGSSLNPQTQTVTMRFELPPQALAYQGQMARLSVTQRMEQAGYWVPLSALTDGIRGTWNLYQLNPEKQSENAYAIRPVLTRVLHTTQDMAYIQANLLDTSMVVASGLHRISPHQKVKINPQRLAGVSL